MNFPIIKINTPTYEVVYLQGNKFAEGLHIIYKKWLDLGFVMSQNGMNFSHIHRVFISYDDKEHSSLYPLVLKGEFPNNINDLPEDVKKFIFNPEPQPQPNPVQQEEVKVDAVQDTVQVDNVSEVSN